MRERYDEILRASCSTALAFWHRYAIVLRGQGPQDTDTVETNRHLVLADGYLQNQWSVDILSPGGFSEMKRIVGFIKDESAKLHDARGG
ncbi:hypothetical protein C8R44DRAFT_815891 [Mycena epipterygia]|nr:hypothetical protein C8R44DRAFT_815891 [Mycena epipterygia]